jgi:serpin B
MASRAIILAACLLVTAMTCLAQAEAPKEPAKADGSKADVAAVADGSNAFALEMYAKLASQDGNLFFSPGSLDTALAMTYAGAAGNTAKQMAKTLHFTLEVEKLHPAFAALIDKLNHPAEITLYDDSGKNRKAPAYELTVANALWGQKGYPFRADFTKLLAASYGAAMNDVDYANTETAREVINNWVATQTKDKIKDLIAKGILTTDTRLVLTNAVYFKSNWDEKFQKAATKDGPFKLSAEKSVDVPLMHLTRHFGYMENDELQAVELPYKAHELAMVILLPKKTDGLAGVEKSLTADNLGKLLKDLKRTKVDLTMPKFKFTSQFGLADTLKAMGMTDAFDPNKADFSGMTSQEKLFISAVIHKAFVAVDEEGTEAAAATAVAMAPTAMPMPEEPKVFKADHPFIFLIRHNSTGEVLFMGRVTNPKAE